MFTILVIRHDSPHFEDVLELGGKDLELLGVASAATISELPAAQQLVNEDEL